MYLWRLTLCCKMPKGLLLLNRFSNIFIYLRNWFCSHDRYIISIVGPPCGPISMASAIVLWVGIGVLRLRQNTALPHNRVSVGQDSELLVGDTQEVVMEQQLILI